MTAATTATHNIFTTIVRSIMSPPSLLFLSLSRVTAPGQYSGLEGRVDRYPIAVGKPIGFVGHAGHRHDLTEHWVRHAGLAGSRGVAGNAVGAAVGHANRQINHFLGERIERAGRHDLLHAFPGALQGGRIAREIFPENIDVRHVTGPLDVVIDGAYARRGVCIFDHRDLPVRELLTVFLFQRQPPEQPIFMYGNITPDTSSWDYIWSHGRVA